jgi:hypothetical protein
MASLVALRHALHRVRQRAEILHLQLRRLDSLLRPILMQPADVVLRALEEEQFVAHALLDEDAAGVLVDDGLFVLVMISKTFPSRFGCEEEEGGRLTATIAFSTFSASPGFAASPFSLIVCSFCSFCMIRFSS